MIPEIEIDHKKCDREGLCVRVCAEGIFERKDKGAVPDIVHPEKCSFCGQCIAVCPSDAITHSGFEMTNFPPITPDMAVEPDRLMGFLRSRRSVRNYNRKRTVRRDVIGKILEAARYAPTGSNAQSLQYIVVNSREMMDKLASLCVDLLRQKVLLFQDEASFSKLDPRVAIRIRADLPFYESLIAEYEAGKDPFFYQAPILIVIHADLTITSTPLEDATLAAYQMMLIAQSLGLGTCIVGNLYEFGNESQDIRDMLAIPPKNDILMSLILGYPAVRFRKLVDRKQPNVRWLGWD
jgi:nitroreductase/NAD-dependent dihydropyrimidine dehydrogenase PreA subunit